MNIDDLLDHDLLKHHVNEGNVVEQVHPTFPLKIYNYSKTCQYDSGHSCLLSWLSSRLSFTSV